jgi:hypothetical protein
LLFVAGTFPQGLGIHGHSAAALRWICVGLTVIVPIAPYVAYRRHRSQTNVPYRLAFKTLDSMYEQQRGHDAANFSELERSAIAETVEAVDANRNRSAAGRRAGSSAKQTIYDRIAGSTGRG